MKGITLWQPWAQLVAIEAKQIETRSWSTDYRGVLAIHASKNTDWLSICKDKPFREALADADWNIGHSEYKRYVSNWMVKPLLFPLGAVIAVCEIVACVEIPASARRFPIGKGKLNQLIPPDPPEARFGDYRPGRFAWILGNIQALNEPIPCRGYQQLWDVPQGILNQIEAQLQ